jgi:hypothetical protein
VAADQTTDPDGGVGADAEALILSLGVTVGDRLDGRYRLERVLHTTGPAITWLAADEKLNRPNRIHLLRSDQPRAEAFMAAARATTTSSRSWTRCPTTASTTSSPSGCTTATPWARSCPAARSR